MTADAALHGIRGALVHAPVLGEMEMRPDAVLAFDGHGLIRHVLDHGQEDGQRLARHLAEEGRLTCLGPDQLLLPGMVDLHVHAPQFPQLGTGLDLPLEDWLMRYTFPLEARYADTGFARDVYGRLVDVLLAEGTTTAVYFATLHAEASLVLSETCLRRGQRAFVGRLSMDNPDQCPEFYREAGAAESIAATRVFIEAVRDLAGNGHALVKPVVTPRFLPSCTDTLLDGLGRLAASHQCHVQTHCSESDWQHLSGLQRFGASDTVTLERFGLLTDRTILAHCNFIDEADIGRIRGAGTGIAHCPLSNVYFSNAAFACRQALEAGVHVGLGSDVAGGPSPSLIANMQMAVHVSRLLEDGLDRRVPAQARGRKGSRLSAREAFWMATTGGGLALGEPIGLFRPGYRFDAILFDADNPGYPAFGPIRQRSAPDVIDRLVYAGSATAVRKVWVDGRLVVDKEAAAAQAQAAHGAGQA